MLKQKWLEAAMQYVLVNPYEGFLVCKLPEKEGVYTCSMNVDDEAEIRASSFLIKTEADILTENKGLCWQKK